MSKEKQRPETSSVTPATPATSDGQAQPQPAKKRLTKTHVLMGVIIIALLAVIWFLLRPKPPEPVQGGNWIVTEENVDTIMGDMQARVREGMFETYMSIDWSFPDGSSPSSNAVIGNAKANTKPFYFEIVLNDTGEVVYTSNALPVGTRLRELKLDKALDNGVYDATCVYYLLNDDGSEFSSMGIEVTLRIGQ